jgi:8-oxo-dGTP pyrophosphatase MutT (NUDIX family)
LRSDLPDSSIAADLEARLRQALAGSSEAAPRPVSRIELPFQLEKKLITPKLLSRLRPAAVLVPVLRRPSGLHVLFTLRSDKVRSHRGQISFPGGRREEDDETLAAAALREAEEEIALPPAAVEVIGYLDDYPTITKYMVTPVVGMVDGDPDVRPCIDEVAEVFEVPLTFLLAEANFERKLFSRSGINVPVMELNYGDWRIWGATAGMLWNLAQKMSEKR